MGGKKKWSANIKHLVYMEPSFLRERAARHPICTRTSRGKLVFMLLGTVISRWGFLSAALLKISVCRCVLLVLLLVTCQAGLSPHTLCLLIIYTADALISLFYWTGWVQLFAFHCSSIQILIFLMAMKYCRNTLPPRFYYLNNNPQHVLEHGVTVNWSTNTNLTYTYTHTYN